MIDVVLVGIKGYGAHHLVEYLKRVEEGKIRIVGVVDPVVPDEETKNFLNRNEIPYFTDLESFYIEGKADLVNISSPIQFHREQTCLALSHGSHVHCEKPIAATTEEVLEMIQAKNKYNLNVGIGYQWAYSAAIQNLKRDIMDGRFGKAIRLKSLVLWPRDENYFKRSWAGKVKDEKGRWVLDSVAANATTHFLQNMFYVLGNSLAESALPVSVVAETYRANKIENYDTSVIRSYTNDGVEIFFLASHAIQKSEEYGPTFEYEFEDAIISYHNSKTDGESATIKATYRDGRTIDYGSPFDQPFNKIDVMINSTKDHSIQIPCTLETASAQSLCISGVQESVPNPVPFPEDLTSYNPTEKINYVTGLNTLLKQCYNEWKMPNELGIKWASCGKVIDMKENKLYQVLN